VHTYCDASENGVRKTSKNTVLQMAFEKHPKTLCSHNRKAALHGTVGSRETASILQGCVMVDGLQKNMMVFHCPVGRYTIRCTVHSRRRFHFSIPSSVT